ncbi:hypothetical protein L1987_37598 [Smallanthus sonchifolius]|uniref:Uncharacterized protein n=1 Tax=Smallanthus sonchifolius TaxID=185202 RepID=A0ACB9HH78_9ASTR|nr:hypothetical protein L1987_37598 [Smallanthus sonchifolius]
MLYTVSIPKSCLSYPKTTWHSPNLKRSGLRVSTTISEPNEVKLKYTPWLIVGLGNPRNKYHGTRHNSLEAQNADYSTFSEDDSSKVQVVPGESAIELGRIVDRSLRDYLEAKVCHVKPFRFNCIVSGHENFDNIRNTHKELFGQ